MNPNENEEQKTSQPNVIKGSQRSDGTWRKEIKIKPGYVPPEEVARYKTPHEKLKTLKANPKKQVVAIDLLKIKQMEEANKIEEEKREIKRKKNQAKRQKKRMKEEKIKQQANEDNNQTQNSKNKKVKQLQKKIKEIHALQKKQDDGLELNKDELNKILTKDDLVQKLEALQINN